MSARDFQRVLPFESILANKIKDIHSLLLERRTPFMEKLTYLESLIALLPPEVRVKFYYCTKCELSKEKCKCGRNSSIEIETAKILALRNKKLHELNATCGIGDKAMWITRTGAELERTEHYLLMSLLSKILDVSKQNNLIYKQWPSDDLWHASFEDEKSGDDI